MQERDPKTGRFLPGNLLSEGNRGNTKPKWGNKNARTHGLYGRFSVAHIDEQGWLNVRLLGKGGIRLHPDVFYLEADGWFYIRNDIADMLSTEGWV